MGDRESPWFKNPDWHMVWITILLFVVGVYTACVFHRQFQEMQTQTGILHTQAQQAAVDSIEAANKVERQLAIAQRQAKAAQDSVNAIKRQMRVDQRPWIHIEYAAKVWPDRRTGALRIPVSIINGGKTPAIHVVGHVFFEIVHQHSRPRFSESSRPDVFEAGTIFPGQPAPQTISRVRWKNGDETMGPELDRLDPDEIKAVDSGAAYIVVYGPITYNDIFRIRHETRWCNYLDVEGPAKDEVSSCAEYNKIDQK